MERLSSGILSLCLAWSCSGWTTLALAPETSLSLRLHSRELRIDTDGTRDWRLQVSEMSVPAGTTALLICDVWDRHWSRGATARVDELAPRINRLAATLRRSGVLVIHAPSDTLAFYAGHPARLRASAFPAREIPTVNRIELPPLPIDDSDGGSDTGEKPWYPAWSRQHPAIEIDPERDIISDDGHEIAGILLTKGIRRVLFAGVHTNMCVLKSRSFSLKPLAEKGFEVILVRDLTDAMYNPERPPYVSHAEGTRLVVEYIEKFLCPSVSSTDILPGGPRH